MNRWSLVSLIGVTALAVAAGVTVAMIQSTPENDSTNPTQSSPTMTSNSSESEPSPQNSQPATNPSEALTNANPQESIAPQENTQLSRQIQSCAIKMAIVDDPESPLNVRSSPTTAAQNVVGQVKNGTYLVVVKDQNGWLQITDPLQGWVAKSRTQHGCNEKVERVKFGTGKTSAEIGDRFVGTGFHKYLFNARAGQTMTVTRQSGPFPFLGKPDGQPLAEITDERDRWSGQLPAAGDYILQLDSNYKGYAYSFLIEIK